MGHSPSWEANSFTASLEMPLILWKPMLHYCVYSYPSFAPILKQINNVLAFHHISLRFILILHSYLRLVLQSDIFPSGFPNKTLYAPLLSHTRATCPAHLMLLDLIPPITFRQQNNSWHPSLCSLLYSLGTSSLLRPVSSSAPYSGKSASWKCPSE
jgi:hypothetical protein